MAGKQGQQKQTTVAFREALNRYITRKRANPFYLMARVVGDDALALDVRLTAATHLAQYLQPKLRSVELTTAADNPVEVLHRLPQADLDALILRLLRQTGYPAPAAAPDPEAPCP